MKRKKESVLLSAFVFAGTVVTGEMMPPDVQLPAVEPVEIPVPNTQEIKEETATQQTAVMQNQTGPAESHEEPEPEQAKSEVAEPATEQQPPQINAENKEQSAVHAEEAVDKLEEEVVPEEDDQSNLDTIDIEEGGNWLLKRKALEEVVDTIESINRLFTKIFEISTTYKIERNKLYSEYDAFIVTLGFDFSDIAEVMDKLVDDLENERKEQGDLTGDERMLMEDVAEKKKELAQLKEDIKTLYTSNDEIDKAITILDDQIKLANSYQNQAWQKFQEIKKILSDERSDELLYQTEGLYKNMQEIQKYFTTDFQSYFNDEAQSIRNQMNKIKETIQSLQKKGIDLRQEFQKIEEQEKEQERELTHAQEDEILKKAIDEEKTKIQSSWWQSIKNVFTAPFRYVFSWF